MILSNPDSVKKDFERAADHCREVLNVEENNSKALYRLGQAQFHTGDFEKAVDNLNKAIKAGASGKAAKNEKKILKTYVVTF